jgi:hypothetical protein
MPPFWSSHHVGHLAGDGVHDHRVDTDPSAAEHLAGELEQDTLVRRHGRSFRWLVWWLVLLGTDEKAGPWRW